MELFLTVMILLVMIVISNIMNRCVPQVPVPLFQVGLGIAAALLPLGIHVPLDPELFFILFIAPLLFNDGKMTPRDELWKLKGSILLLALGLVFVTVFAIGYFVHWMIPSIPLPAAFALAAILSPTDAVAVSALAKRIHLPRDILRLLQGEALMNDASGLVAFKFAVAAMVTGAFSWGEAALSFALVAIGGLLCGAVSAFLIFRLRRFISKFGMEDATFHMLLQMLTPFVIFFIAEELGVSGILAVVAAGIVHAVELDHAKYATVQMQVVSSSTWSVILFILNGLVFILLGLQIPEVSKTVFADQAVNNTLVIGYIAAITLALIGLRFLWVHWFVKETNIRTSIMTALSGVRGAVTLAGAFSIPFALQDGSDFPERSLLLFIAAGVILFTLLMASVLLPLLTIREQGSEETDRIERKARRQMVQAGIHAVRQEMTDKNREAALSVISDYEKWLQLHTGDISKGDDAYRKMETKVRMAGLLAERKELGRLLAAGQISRQAVLRSERMVNDLERAFSQRLRYRLYFPLLIVRRIWSKWTDADKSGSNDRLETMRSVKIRTSRAAIAELEEQRNERNRQATDAVIGHYRDIIERLSGRMNRPDQLERLTRQKQELQFAAIQAERNEVQLMYEQGEISLELARHLRKLIHYTEAVMIEEDAM